MHAAVVQVETGSAITWKYPSVVLKGDNSVGEFYSVALTNNRQQVRRGAARATRAVRCSGAAGRVWLAQPQVANAVLASAR